MEITLVACLPVLGRPANWQAGIGRRCMISLRALPVLATIAVLLPSSAPWSGAAQPDRRQAARPSEIGDRGQGAPSPTSCQLYVSPTGSDSNAGTLSAPWRTVQRAFKDAPAGQRVCFRGGTYAITNTTGYSQTL